MHVKSNRIENGCAFQLPYMALFRDGERPRIELVVSRYRTDISDTIGELELISKESMLLLSWPI